MSPELTVALQLKNEGNELYRKQDYVGALAKYSEALTLDNKNAVLFVNRAACNYGLNKYLNTLEDAQTVLRQCHIHGLAELMRTS
ncbi:hypothetical protein K503DRAFT_576173 [Rhizopogon vinicolor AM-OR11-026]|uniref:TPR-like protein n=1 Tax=Rhizopogon vinicolor AM-OR11-026 TaxID=1314800 RepID=A0A1B7MJL9_9AGAM|nr:hypothetical protein K503DRAFT_576173 [Rhizopogon vinicolor AM-OR11-026]